MLKSSCGCIRELPARFPSYSACRVHFEQHEWDTYLKDLGEYAERFDHQFLRQVPYDHFDHFNEHYPWFDIDELETSRTVLTAKQIYKKIRYFNNLPLDFWYKQFDGFLDEPPKYIVFQSMLERRTWSFPPIVMQNKHERCSGRCSWEYGAPLLLIEGTHRISYLCRMLEREMVAPDSKHELVLLDPN
jgi:hypothetical protein